MSCSRLENMVLLWKECASWLIRCGILPSDHKVTWPNAQVFDLAQILRDGVLLCQLSNTLVPNSIDLKLINQRPQLSQFLCQKNIEAFLHSCQMIFEINSADLFDACDLFNLSNFGQVLRTMSILSKSTKAVVSNIQGFPTVDNRHHQYNNESIYMDLEDLANKRSIPDEDQDYKDDYVDYEDIYEDVCGIHQPKESPTEMVPSAPKLSKREHVTKELVETEQNYVRGINSLIMNFKRPLKTVIPEDKHQLIFRHIEELHTVHTGFYNDLQRAYTTGSMSIADCVLKWRDKFLVYGNYCSNLPSARQCIDELCATKESIKQTVVNCQERANENKHKFQDLLAVPMQRVLRYQLLMKELWKATPDMNEDKPDIEKALNALQDLSLYINEVKRDEEELLERISKIEQSIIDLGDAYIYKEAVVLKCMVIQEPSPNAKRDKWSYCWEMTADDYRVSAYHFYAASEEAKRKWIEAIKMAQDNTQPEDCQHTDHKFTMYTFIEPQVCTACGKLLRGVFCQGYKCVKPDCIARVHKECILASKCGKYRVNRALDANVLGHLSLQVGDTILVTNGSESDTYWTGYSMKAKEHGLFPRSHVEKIVPKRGGSYLETGTSLVGNVGSAQPPAIPQGYNPFRNESPSCEAWCAGERDTRRRVRIVTFSMMPRCICVRTDRVDPGTHTNTRPVATCHTPHNTHSCIRM
ncbi:PREDICTED: proto-oncogene vav-like isoform X2 [Priapulus caudatus]|uniref:Proto-oncogene vav-like isoform X2 n=1 Tax=Priapulus caudatus TaxID=37621 RepID=A0ABM1E8E5_PRICU|nr:PREDICTED: proto-oncogene vav-like isoform X2 [Priapulus caudatus]